MNNLTPVNMDAPAPRSITNSMASRYGMEPGPFEATLRATVVPSKCTKEQFAAFLLVAKEHNLNPVTKEIYAFPARAGGIQPIVSIDGWMNIINSHKQFDGMEFKDVFDSNGALQAITCRMYRKDRAHAIEVTEYMSECRKETDTWKKWPARMLRHKAAIQCARYCFGFSGIVDEDEYERAQTVTHSETPTPPAPPAPVVEVVPEPESQQVTEVTEPVEPDELAPPHYDEMISDLEARLSAGDDTTQAEIWESEIEPMIENMRIFPPDVERLKAKVRAA